jgi:3',5'-cyclic AMP phosphodiesterase CpdA
MLIAQISDLHVKPAGELAYGKFDSTPNVARCVEHIRALDPVPDAVLATGDLVHGGTPAEYSRLREILAPLTMPVYPIPGNHDQREAFVAALGAHIPARGPDGTVCYCVENHPLRLIALDTLLPRQTGGALTDTVLDWLGATLAGAPSRASVVFMHHPPIATGFRHMDAIALDATSAARLGAIVERNPQIERVLCGHVHRPIEARWRGTVVSLCPSAAYQARFTLGGGFEPDPREPPAYQLHYWNGGTLVTHTVAVV